MTLAPLRRSLVARDAVPPATMTVFPERGLGSLNPKLQATKTNHVILVDAGSQLSA